MVAPKNKPFPVVQSQNRSPIGLRRLMAGTLLALCCLPAAGCGRGGPERIVVRGTVTYQGQRVEFGHIRFLPAEGTEAPMSGGYISGGRYVADARGGVPVGTHRVEITAFRTDPKYAHLDGALSGEVEAELPSQQYIPAQYNAGSKLTITIPSGSRSIEKDFELE